MIRILHVTITIKLKKPNKHAIFLLILFFIDKTAALFLLDPRTSVQTKKMNSIIFGILVTVLISSVISKSVETRGSMTSLEKECWEHCSTEYTNCKLFYGCRKLPSGEFNKECPFDCVKWSETCLELCL